MKNKSNLFTPIASRACIATATLALMFSLPAVFAAPLYWDGNGATTGAGNTTGLLNKVWGTDSMWNSDSLGEAGTFTAATLAGDDLFFVAGPSATSGQIAFNPTVTGTQLANSITFQSQGAQTLSGGTSIDLGGGGLVGSQFAYGATNRGTVTISSPISLTASQSWINNATTAMTVSGAISGTGDLTLQNTVVGTTGTFAISTGGINHTGSITNSGSGGATTTISAVVGSAVTGITENSATSQLILSAVNSSYAGTTTLTAGTITASGVANNTFTALGTGGIALNGGTLNLRSNGNANGGANIITGNGATGNNVTMGSTGATINVNNNGSNIQNTFTLNNLSIGTGQLTVSGGNQYNLRFAGTTTLTGNATFNVTSSTLGLTLAVGDGGGNFGITKLGAAATGASVATGSLTLSGVNTYTGVTSVLEGILNLNGNAPSGSAGTLGNATSAVLLGNTSGSVNAALMTNNFTVARDITVQSGNTGTAYLGSATNTSNNTYSGIITLGSAGSAGHGLTLVSGGFHQMIVSGVIQDSGTLTGTAGVLTIGDVTAANALTGSFSPNTTNGSSIYLINGANTYTGGTVIDTGGAVRINNTSAFGTGNLSIVRGTIQGNGVTVLTGISGQTWDGNFSINSFSSGGQGAVNLGTSAITLTGNRVVGISNATSTIGGAISGSGRSLQLNGGNSATQALVLNGASTFDGGLTVSGATGFDLTATSGNATGFGTGQLNLTNSTHSKVSLNANTTVDSLTSGIISTATSTAGTGTNGSYSLVFGGGGGGSGAAGTATITGGNTIALSITSFGTNYTSAPTVTLSGGGWTGTVSSGFGSSSIALNARTLTLAGTNASPATYAGIISGSGGSLVKNGTGIQILTGANTYTGATTIAGGTLKLGTGGSMAAGTNVSIAAGGTFDVTDLTISSGTYTWNMASLNASGTATAATITGTAGGTVDLGIKPISLTYNGSNPSLIGSGAALSLGGNQITVVVPGTALGAGVYTLVSAGSITGSVDPTPLYTGGNGVAIGATGVVSISGNSLILTVGAGASNYASWATANGISGEPASDDFDKDGLSNLVEYALGKNPTVSSQPPGTLSGNVLTFTKGSDAIANNDVIFEIEESTDLGISDPWATVVTEGTADDTPDISYTLTPGLSKEFARLKVIQIP